MNNYVRSDNPSMDKCFGYFVPIKVRTLPSKLAKKRTSLLKIYPAVGKNYLILFKADQ